MTAQQQPDGGGEMVRVNGTELRVEGRGTGEPAVVFSPALFTNRELFRPVVDALEAEHRCVSYDHRGQGDSGLGIPQPPRLLGAEGLYDDALALLDELGIARCHWVGASIGGFVGIRLAARHPERIRSLVLIGVSTGAITRTDKLTLEAMGLLLRAGGVLRPVRSRVSGAVAGQVMRNMLGPTFMADPARAADREVWRARFARQVVPEALPMLREVFGHLGEPRNPPQLLAQVAAPTLVIVGEEEVDGGREAREAAATIPDARLVTVPRAAHMVLVEQPELGTAAITDFLREVDSR